MNKIKISAVSYTNTVPLVHGIHHYKELMDIIEMSLDIPSVCAQKLIDKQVDIGFVPVAALLEVPNYQIISDYCIGSNGSVTSVYIFSKKPIEEISTLRLDKQSRTSNKLALVLLKNHWKKEIEVMDGEDADAYVEIGDRTFGKLGSEPYAYDLGEAWTDFCGLPFTYAVWAANKNIPKDFIELFNEALKYGLDHREEVIKGIPQYKNFDIKEYLLKSIDYDLNAEKREAIQLFHQLIMELNEMDYQKALS